MTKKQQAHALQIAMHLRSRAQIASTPGNLDTLSASAANELERQHARIAELEQGKCLHQIAEPAEDIWPCINLDVDEHGAVTNVKIYTPGLPAGNHDVYSVRVPYMDEHTEAWLTCVKELEKFDPTFLNREGMNGIECAAFVIRELVGRAQDAARWREAIKTVGAERQIDGARYVIRGLEAPINVMRGCVAEHFTKSIDAALAAQAKQGGV